jgi:hypothetical protein
MASLDGLDPLRQVLAIPRRQEQRRAPDHILRRLRHPTRRLEDPSPLPLGQLPHRLEVLPEAEPPELVPHPDVLLLEDLREPLEPPRAHRDHREQVPLRVIARRIEHPLHHR